MTTRVLVLWPGEEPCWRCWATGVEPSITTFSAPERCALCDGAGKLNVRRVA